jgi:hypothetical protein
MYNGQHSTGQLFTSPDGSIWDEWGNYKGWQNPNLNVSAASNNVAPTDGTSVAATTNNLTSINGMTPLVDEHGNYRGLVAADTFDENNYDMSDFFEEENSASISNYDPYAYTSNYNPYANTNYYNNYQNPSYTETAHTSSYNPYPYAQSYNNYPNNSCCGGNCQR